ncbi:MAG: sigma-70 family RNA polymerase sigma factor [Planctomycetota bacterium]
MTSPQIDDDQTDKLLALSQQDNDGALTHFFEQYSARLERTVQLRLHPALAGRIDACDIVQEVFVQAIDGLERFLETRPMPVFLWLRKLLLQSLTQAHRRHLNAKRRDVRRERDLEGIPPANSGCIAMELSSSQPTPSRVVSQRETQDKLRAALDALSEADREILALWHFEQLSGPEVAIVLGISHEAAKKRHVRALAKLRSAGGFA